jgi:gliding motility-associated-like protein
MDSSLQLAGGNGDLHHYLWSPADLLDDPTAMNPVTIPPASMQYRVTVTESPCGYDTSFNVNVTVYPNPLAVAWKQRDIDCLNPTVYLGASSSPGDIRFEWSPASGVDNPFSTSPLASADSTTAFVVKTTNEFGCSAYDEVIVKVTNTAKPEFMLANAFSPNGDGVNDCFGIKRWGNVTIHEFSIFNRWGEKVFSTKNPRDCWNGMYKGKPASSGTFVYTIRATSFCGEMVKKGSVQLIR